MMPVSEKERGLSSPDEYLKRINETTKRVVEADYYHNQETGYISKEAWKELVDSGLMDSVLLERDESKRQEEMMMSTRFLSYYDLHLGLTFGIVAALGVLQVQRFASNEEQKEKILDLVREGGLIGLAITERDGSGSAALEMDSSYEIRGDKVLVSFAKHLQGLSANEGMVVALLKKDASRKTVGLFFVPQELMTTQVTAMMGLHGITYGINTAQVELNIKDHLLVELPRERLDEFQDIFIKSRFLFVAMNLGFIERMEAEAGNYGVSHVIEGRSMDQIPLVRKELESIRERRIIVESIFEKVIEFREENELNLLEGDTRGLLMEANIVKTLSTAYSLEVAALRAELMGGRAYYEGSALQDYVDIWPFQIFEGSRLLLTDQIGKAFLGSSRVEGKIVHKSFVNSESSNFLDYFFERSRYRDMFDVEKIEQNLSAATSELLASIRKEDMTTDSGAVMGEIVSRLFALGCLSGDEKSKAVRRVNLEISQLAQNFRY